MNVNKLLNDLDKLQKLVKEMKDSNKKLLKIINKQLKKYEN